jgi:hypothetical protein
MRTIAYAVCALLVSASSAVAQTDQPDSEQAIRSAISRCAITQCILKAPAINAPFSAEATTAWQPPASRGQAPLRTTARYYRDSAGRVRVEQTFVSYDGHSQHIILAPEAGSTTAYVLDPVARTVSTPVPRGLTQMMVGDGGYNQFVLPRSMRRFTVFFVTPGNVESTSATDEESLGEGSMAGTHVTGTRFVTQLPGLLGNGHAERWVSPELGLVVYSRSEDAHFGILEYRLTNISRADPPAELFEVPQGYRETPFEYPVTWDGPYTPKRTHTNTK